MQTSLVFELLARIVRTTLANRTITWGLAAHVFTLTS
jgi:hypothetical protein